MQNAQARAPQPTWPHCLRLLTGRTHESLDVEARYVLDNIELRVRIAYTQAFGVRSWGCVDQRVGREWERVLWVDVDHMEVAQVSIDEPTADWRRIIGDDAHLLATQAARTLGAEAATA